MPKKSCEYCQDPADTCGLCHKHYQYQYYWMRAGVARAREHREKLRIRAAVLEASVPATPLNVVNIEAHPRFKTRAKTGTRPVKKRRAAG